LNWMCKLLFLFIIYVFVFSRDTPGDTRRCLLGRFWPVSR
jgi:hypothetical protein